MFLEITYVQNILVKDSYLLKLLLVALGFGSQTFICGFSRQNICSVLIILTRLLTNSMATENCKISENSVEIIMLTAEAKLK
jgi:hypothetical protein